MKLKNCKRLVLPTVMAGLLVSMPVTSSAYTKYINLSNVAGTTYSNSATIRQNNGYFKVVSKPDQTTKDCDIVSIGKYPKPGTNTNKPAEVPSDNTTKPVEKPEENVKPKPQEPQPDTDTNTGSDTGSTSNGKHSLTASEIQMIEYVNKARQDAGLQPLQIDVDLSYVARLKSQDMSDNKYFSHDSPTYGSPFDMMTKFGIKYRGAAENIAKNSSVEAAHNALMRSQGHKENILNPTYTHIGVGIHNGHYTQMFIRK
ncbi:CAP domain-containing protein [Alkaliphilus sp. B6464]|uniref:CAP domain-containing protein n=1 Tax=Alkaliphilus sp. B6464 TaxID=2731219 RepID=UPI001BA4CD79|nr:CAP domain-containing protein [Alkaliphilus sp. B6464]QUH20607.1 hypothetical protein HYG84_12460 [Alkaliphilus sp. B6464]